MVRRKVASITDSVREHLTAVSVGRGDQVEERLRVEYKKRRLLDQVLEKVYLVRQGPAFTTQVPVPV